MLHEIFRNLPLSGITSGNLLFLRRIPSQRLMFIRRKSLFFEFALTIIAYVPCDQMLRSETVMRICSLHRRLGSYILTKLRYDRGLALPHGRRTTVTWIMAFACHAIRSRKIRTPSFLAWGIYVGIRSSWTSCAIGSVYSTSIHAGRRWSTAVLDRDTSRETSRDH